MRVGSLFNLFCQGTRPCDRYAFMLAGWPDGGLTVGTASLAGREGTAPSPVQATMRLVFGMNACGFFQLILLRDETVRSIRVHTRWLARWGLGSWDCIFGRARGHRPKSAQAVRLVFGMNACGFV